MITKENLLKEISEGELLELSDLDSTGEMDDARIDHAIEEAKTYISSFILIPSNPNPLLISIAVDLALNELRKAQGLGDKEVVREADSKLIKMAKGVISTAISTSKEVNTPRIGNAYAHTKRRYSSITKGFTHGV
ncbi:phage protein Gp36 family protein [Sulfurospirillum cavolei]|uniref:phage protein Gp36 family protein n=1 Tax=Sulfurospirillum cavolei TaxID=366522 RepID=UPI000764C47A|nr:phage protein Gp36 family protein [Sulfurospirillum cavolei]